MLGQLPTPGSPLAARFGQLVAKWNADKRDRLNSARATLADVPMAAPGAAIAACETILLHSDDDAERETAGQTLALYRDEMV